MQVTGSNSNQYTLSIRFSADGFYFALLNPKAKEEKDSYTYYIYKVNESLSLTANLKQAIDELEWLGYTYQAVNIVTVTHRYTLVPMDFFEDEQVEAIFYHNFKPMDNEAVLYQILHKSNAVLLFGIDKAFLTLLQEQFPQAQIQVQAAPLVEYLSTRNRLEKHRQLLCYADEEQITIAAMERRSLLLCNSFTCHCTADRLYYLLYIWKQLGFDQLQDELLLVDNTAASEELKEELSHYIQQVTEVSNAQYLDIIRESI